MVRLIFYDFSRRRNGTNLHCSTNFHLPCGICITATVIPAEMSPGKCDFSEYDGNHFRTGIKFSINWNILKLLNECLTLCISGKLDIFWFVYFSGWRNFFSKTVSITKMIGINAQWKKNHDHIDSYKYKSNMVKWYCVRMNAHKWNKRNSENQWLNPITLHVKYLQFSCSCCWYPLLLTKSSCRSTDRFIDRFGR